MIERPIAAMLAGADWRDYSEPVDLGAVGSAALGMFTELGYHGTSIRLIAREAGISVPGLYYHYTTKQEILVDLLRRSNNEIMWRAHAAREEGAGDPRTAFCVLVENIILFVTHRQTMSRLGREISALEEPFRSEHMARRDELEAMLRHEVENARQSGMFATRDARESTRAVWVMSRGVADWYVPAGPKAPGEIAATYLGFALAVVGDVTAQTRS